MKESEQYNNLLYFNTDRQPRDYFDHGLEYFLSKLARVNTAGSEINIPKQGEFIIGFAPHAGFMEAILIDRELQEDGRQPAVWMTKKENEDLPGFFKSPRRLVYIDRDNPQPSVTRSIRDMLQMPNAIFGSAFEGTRTANPVDPSDVRSLGEMHDGLIRFSITANVPIMGVVVLGVDRILPKLDGVVKEKGMTQALKLVAKGLIKPQTVEIRFLPLYRDHLKDDIQMKGRVKKDFLRWHHEKIVAAMIEEILKIDPNYPLGFYRSIQENS